MESREGTREKPAAPNLSRRRVLQIMVSSTGAVSSIARAGRLWAGARGRAASPGESAAERRWFFDPQELRTLDALCETMIPADQHSPGARAARVHEFIDELMAESQEVTQSFWRAGLNAVDRLANLTFGKKFADCEVEKQIELLTKISDDEQHPATLEARFFVALKQAAIEGYYTSEIGIHQELEYQGNTALAEFPGCTHEGHGPRSSE